MKAPAILLLTTVLVSTTCAQQTTPERPVVKVEEGRRGKKTTTEFFKGDTLVRKQVREQRTGDKPVEAKYTWFYKDGKQVLFEGWDSQSKETVRYYSRDGRLVMAEVDKDSDGVFEWLVLYNDNEDVFAVFKRGKGGEIEALGNDAVEAFKRGSQVFKDVFQR